MEAPVFKSMVLRDVLFSHGALMVFMYLLESCPLWQPVPIPVTTERNPDGAHSFQDQLAYFRVSLSMSINRKAPVIQR